MLFQDYHILQMKFEGFFDRLMGDFFRRTGDHTCIDEETLDLIAVEGALNDEEEDTQSLSLQEMGGIFIVHAILSCVALLLAMGKFYQVKRALVHSSVRNLIKKGSLRNTSSQNILDVDTDASDDPCQQKLKHKKGLSRTAGAAMLPDTEQSSKNLQPILEGKEDHSCFPNMFDDLDASEGKLSV